MTARLTTPSTVLVLVLLSLLAQGCGDDGTPPSAVSLQLTYVCEGVTAVSFVITESEAKGSKTVEAVRNPNDLSMWTASVDLDDGSYEVVPELSGSQSPTVQSVGFDVVPDDNNEVVILVPCEPSCDCSDELAPVCGMNGQLYRNECEAECARVDLALFEDCNGTVDVEFSFTGVTPTTVEFSIVHPLLMAPTIITGSIILQDPQTFGFSSSVASGHNEITFTLLDGSEIVCTARDSFNVVAGSTTKLSVNLVCGT